MIRTKIIGGGEIQQGDCPGISIDLDLGDVGAWRISEVRRIVKGRLVEAGLDRIDRIIVRHIGGQSDLGERHRPAVPATVNCPLSNSMSASETSSRWAAIFLPFLTTLSLALTRAEPPTAS